MSTNTSSWLQQQISEREDYKNEGKYQRRITFRSIICNKTVKGWLFLTVFAAVVPFLVYYFVIDKGTYSETDSATCSVRTTFRVPCGKVNISSNDCEKLQCCYEISSETCYHYLPSKYSYDFDYQTSEYAALQSTSPYGTVSVKTMEITVNEIDKDKVSIILHEKGVKVDSNKVSSNKDYKVVLAKEKLMAEIFRKSTNDILLSTTKGPLIASEKYWEWSFYLTDEFLFGLNQTLISLSENSTFTKVIYKNKNDHYTLPVFWAYKNKQFHGVVIKHEGPIEITILPSYMVLLKSLTGEKIELELSLGPTPKSLHDQQLGEHKIPPLWALDTFSCNKGTNLNLTELIQEYKIEDTVGNTCISENLFIGITKDNGVNTDILNDTLTQLKEKRLKFLLPIPPQIFSTAEILYNKSLDLNILYTYNGTEYKGRSFKEAVVYPDYSHKNIQSYMAELGAYLSSYIDVQDIDGFVFYDNWPVNSIYTVDNDSLPYLSEELMEAMSYTLPWDSTVKNSTILHVQTHNSYGPSQMSAFKTYYNSTKPDIFIISATNTFGDIQTELIQNVDSSWDNLQDHIDNILFNSIVGNHLVSVPVCGDTDAYSSTIQETLCIRWYLVAATMPMFRISSSQPYRNPTNLNSQFAGQVAESALSRRRSLLSHYYTILNRNEPVVRPMFYDYYENVTTFDLKRQYMIGEEILVAHPFSTGRSKLQVYLPSRVGIWYEIWGGDMYNTKKEAWIDVDIVETDFVAFVAQGTVLPLLVDNNIDFVIALNCTSIPCTASGSLYQGHVMTFEASDTEITVSNIPQENCNYTLATATVYFYNKDTGGRILYDINNDICTGEKRLVIPYENNDTTTTVTTTV